MKRLLVGLLVLVTPLWAGCDSSSETDTYSITLSDEDGTAILGGELRLVIGDESQDNDPRDVSGSWELTGRNGQPDPMVTSGSLSGELLPNDDDIVLRLEMEAADSGIELAGTYDGDRITGEWSEITIAGPQPRGAFEAVRG